MTYSRDKESDTLKADEMSVDTSDKRPIEFWDEEDAEILYYGEINEAVEAILDRHADEPAPTSIDLFGYARMEVPRPHFQVLESLLERLWEQEYSGEDQPEPTPAMEEAEQRFMDVMEKEFVPWGCEIITKAHTIDCKAWVAEHHPDWKVTWDD